jgi:hypothetical protein
MILKKYTPKFGGIGIQILSGSGIVCPLPQ